MIKINYSLIYGRLFFYIMLWDGWFILDKIFFFCYVLYCWFEIFGYDDLWLRELIESVCIYVLFLYICYGWYMYSLVCVVYNIKYF